MRGWLLTILMLACTGCLDQSREKKTITDVVRPSDPSAAQTNEAEDYIQALDDDLQRLAALPPAARRERELAMEPRLAKAVEVASGTRLENKAVYYHANWRYTFREGDGVEALLNRLAGLSSPAMKVLGQRLRALLMLRQGRIPEARAMAQALVADAPEFSPLMERVVFHETVGAVAPKISSRNLSGGPDDPVGKRPETWLLYVFIDLVDDGNLFLVDRYLASLDVLPADQRRLVCVTFETNLLSATTRMRRHPRAGEIDLLWAGPGEHGNAKDWLAAWKLPTQNPHIALLGPGPERTVMAVEVTPESLGALLAPPKK